MPKPLNLKQRVILDFLKEEIREKGFPPTIREICEISGLSSTSTVHSHLQTLENLGYIKRSPNKNRSIEIMDNSFYEPLRNALSIPVLSKISPDLNLSVKENIEGYFPVAADVIGESRCFILRINGGSMADAGLFHGDLALIRRQDTLTNGDIAAFLLEGTVTVKTYYTEGNFIRLQPESKLFDPIVTDKAVIVGKVIGIFRVL